MSTTTPPRERPRQAGRARPRHGPAPRTANGTAQPALAGLDLPGPHHPRHGPVHPDPDRGLRGPGLLPLGHHFGADVRGLRQLLRSGPGPHRPGVLPEHHRVRGGGRGPPAGARPGAGHHGAGEDAGLAARVLPLGLLLPADPVRGLGVHLHAVPLQRAVRRGQLVPVPRGHPRGAVADHAGRVRRRRDPCVRVAELRVLLPAVHRRPGLHSRGDIRSGIDRRRHRLAQAPAT